MDDLSISDVLRDPLIRLVLRADGVSLADFAVLIADVSSRLSIQRWETGTFLPKTGVRPGFQGVQLELDIPSLTDGEMMPCAYVRPSRLLFDHLGGSNERRRFEDAQDI